MDGADGKGVGMGGNDVFRIEFGGAMLPAMLRALMIARNTAMSYPNGQAVMAEMQAQYDALSAQCGIPNLRHVVQEYAWFAAANAIAEASAYHWHTRSSPWSDDADVTLVIDGRAYRLSHRLRLDTPNIEAIMALMERHAHVGAVKGDPVGSRHDHEPPEPVEAPAAPGA